MKSLKKVIVLGLMLCFVVSFFIGCSSNDITISYNHVYDASIESKLLPKNSQQKVEKNSKFLGLKPRNGLKPVEYRVYENETEFSNLYLNQIITENIKIVVVWNDEENNKEEYKDFNSVITKLRLLEEISEKYNTEKSSDKNANLRAMQYIRQKRYSGLAWSVIAGNLEKDFNQYVLDNQPENANLQSLQDIDKLIAPKTKEEIDFVHLIAVVNVILNSEFINSTNTDLASWGGDICQLAIQLKQTGLTGNELQEKAGELFNNKTSSFSCYDLLADIDAYNIINIYYLLGNNSVSETMEQYYTLGNSDLRNTMFIKLLLPDLNLEGEQEEIKTTLKETLKARLDSNMLISVWCSTQGEPYANITVQVDACLNEFINYLIG